MQRPAYLTNAPDLSQRAVQGMGSVLPPHVSIRSNQFTLVDGAGNRKPVGQTMDFLVADIGDHVGKMFFADPDWSPDSDSPPDCWSTNGVGPSREAINPQARTCADCPQNVRGSRISKMGSSVKACRDEVLIGIVHPQFAGMLFQMKITPGSFKNWRKHVEECKNISPQDNVGTVLTRATFDTEQTGVLIFKAVSYPDEATWAARTKAVESKATDILVGRLDRPRELPAPSGVGAATTAAPQLAPPPVQPNPQATGFNPQQHQPATTAEQAQPEQQRRKRRTKAEIEADNARQSAPAFGQAAANPLPSASTQPAMAPFRPEAPAGGNGAAFGIGQAPSPSADVQAALDQAFGASPPQGGFGSK